MELILIYSVVVILAGGALSHDEDEEFVEKKNAESMFIPKDYFNLSSVPTTLEPRNESISTTEFLNVTTSQGNVSETEMASKETTETENSSEVVTDQMTTEFQDKEDLAVTDSSGCYVNMKHKIEEACFDMLEQVILKDIEVNREKEVCCAFEKYEKCASLGLKKAKCQVDQQELKAVLASGRIFIAAMTGINCAEHKQECPSSATRNISFGFSFVTVLLVLLLLNF